MTKVNLKTTTTTTSDGMSQIKVEFCFRTNLRVTAKIRDAAITL